MAVVDLVPGLVTWSGWRSANGAVT